MNNEIEIIRTNSNGVGFEEALQLAEGKTLASNATMDAILQNDELRRKYADAFSCWTGTIVVYTASGQPFKKYVKAFGMVFDIPEEYQGKSDLVLVLKHPDVRIELGTYDMKVLKGKVVKALPMKEDGWYLVDEETGIPCGAPSSSSDINARRLYRRDGEDYIGPLVRWGDDFVDDRRGVNANGRPGGWRGVVLEVAPAITSAKAKDWKQARKKPIVVEYREVVGEKEEIHTREGVLFGYAGKDVIIKGVQGELYPCKKEIFDKTYELLPEKKSAKSKAVKN